MIAEIHQVLTPAECDLFIAYARRKLVTLKVVNKGVVPGVRNAVGAWVTEPLYDNELHDINFKLRYIAHKLVGSPIDNQEDTHVIKYDIGGEYKEHYDFFYPDHLEHAKHLSRGGQREHSLLVYLNDNYVGGQTRFIVKGIDITPKTGKLLMWSNLNDDGTPDYGSKHAGLPIISGEKWIAVIWVRQQKFVSRHHVLR